MAKKLVAKKKSKSQKQQKKAAAAVDFVKAAGQGAIYGYLSEKQFAEFKKIMPWHLFGGTSKAQMTKATMEEAGLAIQKQRALKMVSLNRRSDSAYAVAFTREDLGEGLAKSRGTSLEVPACFTEKSSRTACVWVLPKA